jgi:Tfp pilus assembly protein PilN
MSRLRLNLVDRSWPALVWSASPKIWLAAGLGALVLCMAMAEGLNLRQQLATAKLARQGLVDRLDRRSARNTGREAPVNIAPAQALAINAAVRQLNLPWTELMEALEAASTPEVAVLEWSPQAESATLKGVAEARTSDDMIAYARKLKEQTFFTAVELTSHQVNEQDRNKPLRFDFVVSWRSPSSP